jgi:hypothetical protein
MFVAKPSAVVAVGRNCVAETRARFDETEEKSDRRACTG